jgi:hypothetical protein
MTSWSSPYVLHICEINPVQVQKWSFALGKAIDLELDLV